MLLDVCMQIPTELQHRLWPLPSKILVQNSDDTNTDEGWKNQCLFPHHGHKEMKMLEHLQELPATAASNDDETSTKKLR